MKFTKQLTKLLNNKDTPESIVKFIYINVFELIKESISFRKSEKHINLFNDLSAIYIQYYKNLINSSPDLWVKTIFPPYINGYKNFYRGIAGRISFFSVDINTQYVKLNSPDIDKYCASLIASYTPDAYYWYGNPINWSYCYEIKLNELKEIVIRKRQIFVLEDENSVYEAMVDEKEVPNSIFEILLLYKTNTDLDYVEEQPDSFPTRTGHHTLYNIYNFREDQITVNLIEFINESNSRVNSTINELIERYKSNVSLKNGYNIEIQKLWDEYNKIKIDSSKQRFQRNYINHKLLKEEEINELQSKFLIEYTEKINKLKQEKKV